MLAFSWRFHSAPISILLRILLVCPCSVVSHTAALHLLSKGVGGGQAAGPIFDCDTPCRSLKQ